MSKLRIKTRSNGDVTILDLAGDLTAGHGAHTLRRKLWKLNIDSQYHILISHNVPVGQQIIILPVEARHSPTLVVENIKKS